MQEPLSQKTQSAEKPGIEKGREYREQGPNREERQPDKGSGRKKPSCKPLARKTTAAYGWDSTRAKRTVTVFERIGSPSSLPKADEIPDGLMGTMVHEMHRRFNSRGILLSTLSPNVRPRELYEFMTSEFLRVEITASDTPALHCFVYDAFRPDPWHTNERRALEYCIRILLQKENRLHMFPNGRPITINGHRDLSESEFRGLMHAFRSSHSDIVNLHTEAVRTTVKEDLCIVIGRHVTGLCSESSCRIAKGAWKVEFLLVEEIWAVRSVHIEGIDF